jgi:hypothetical protein
MMPVPNVVLIYAGAKRPVLGDAGPGRVHGLMAAGRQIVCTVGEAMHAGVKNSLRWAASAAVVLFSLLLFPPWRPAMPSAGLDPAWFMVIAHALEHGWQFGRDVIFTYGPLGSLAPPSFYPGLFLVSMAYWLVFYAAFGTGFVLLYRQSPGVLWVVPFVALLVAGLSPIQDGRVFAACFVLFLVGRLPGRNATVVALLLAIIQAIAALMKMTYAFASLPIVVLTDIARYARFGAVPLLTPLYLATYLIVYLAAGQHPSSLWPYLTTAMDVSRGYNDTMAAYAPIGEIVSFGLIAVTAALLVAWQELTRADQRRIGDAAATFLAFGVIVFLAAKAGFVRHDIGHAIIPWAALPLMLAAYLGSAPARTLAPKALLAGLAAASLVYFAQAYLSLTPTPIRTPREFVSKDVLGMLRADVVAVRQFVFQNHYRQLLREWPEFLKSIAAHHPLPGLDGPTGISGSDQAILFAHGADYRPHPAFQSYSAYTPGLIARNIEFLRSPVAPQSFFLKVSSIDGRYPALDEGALWPDLLRLYDIVAFEHGYAVLKRRTAPRDLALEALQDANVAFGETLSLPAAADDIVWLEADIRPSLLGRLRSILFKPPIVDLTVELDDGRTVAHRLIPGMAGSGFVLSPYIERTDQFVALATMRQPRVSTVTIGPAKLGGTYFRESIAVRFKRMRIGGSDEWPMRVDKEALLRRQRIDALMASGPGSGGQAQLEFLPDNAVLARVPMRLSLNVSEDTAQFAFANVCSMNAAWAPSTPQWTGARWPRLCP